MTFSLSDIVAAAEHGAALVYHEILAVESDVTSWTSAHPEVGPLIAAGERYAAGLFGAAGFPAAPEIISAGSAVLSALKAMAAADPTVQSGTGGPAQLQPVAPAPAPAAEGGAS